MSRAALLVLLITVTVPAKAAAGRSSVDSDPVTEAVERAVEYWGSTPCGGQVAVVGGVRSEAPPAGANSDGAAGEVAAMWSTWSTPAGATLFTEPATTFTDCVVHVNLSVWPSWRADDRRFSEFCKSMVHEYGHFEGHPDVGAAPGTVEYERPFFARVPACERYRLVYGHTTYSSSSPHRAGSQGSVKHETHDTGGRTTGPSQPAGVG